MKAITLFLMGYKGFHTLRVATEEFTNLFEEVVTARDPNVVKDYYDEIVSLCAEVGIRCVDRTIAGPVRTQYAVAISWRWLIDIPEQRLIIVHDSLLPRYRGFNPLVSCLINGETTIGVTALFGAAHYDRGDIIAQAAAEIRYPIRIAEAIEIVTTQYQLLARKLFKSIAHGRRLKGQRQDESRASFSLWRDEEDYRIPWDADASWIARFVDAVGFPYMGAMALVNGTPARILVAKSIPDVTVENRVPGKVIWIESAYPVVVCGSGLLKVLELVDDATGDPMVPLARFRSRFS